MMSWGAVRSLLERTMRAPEGGLSGMSPVLFTWAGRSRILKSMGRSLRRTTERSTLGPPPSPVGRYMGIICHQIPVNDLTMDRIPGQPESSVA